MNFLRQIALCYDKIGSSSKSYDHILKDLSLGNVITYREAAKKYYGGNETSMYKAADRIKSDFYYDALNYDSYHNEAQREVMEVRIRAASVHKLLHMGFRIVGIETAIQTYKAALRYHIFEIAADLASIVSQHYGLHVGDDKLCKEWHNKYLSADKQRQISCLAKHNFALSTSSFRVNKSNNKESIDSLYEVVDLLSKYEDEAESYIYWTYLFTLKIYYYELTGNFEMMRKVASQGYAYFSELSIDHRSAKLLLLAQVIHSLNLSRNYDQAIRFSSLVKDLNNAGTNKDLALLRLSKSYINLNQEDRALELLNSIKGSLTDVEEKIDLYKSYCTGIHPALPEKEDPHGMDIAYKIAILYCDVLNGKTDRYTHNYILKYIRRHAIGRTREGLILKILSIMRHRGFDDKKFKRYETLRIALTEASSSLTEIEILQYEKMLEKIDELYGD